MDLSDSKMSRVFPCNLANTDWIPSTLEMIFKNTAKSKPAYQWLWHQNKTKRLYIAKKKPNLNTQNKIIYAEYESNIWGEKVLDNFTVVSQS